MNRADLIEAYESGDIGRTEFFELALDAGLSLTDIEDVLQRVESES